MARKRAQAAINAGDPQQLQTLLERYPGLQYEDPGLTLLGAAAQPEAGAVPREIVDLLVEAGSDLDVPLNLAACFDKPDLVNWLLDAGGDATATPNWGITPLQTAVYHGARAAADVLVTRTGLLPDAFYVAAAAGDIDRVGAFLDSGGSLRPEAMAQRPNLADVGWPPRAPSGPDARDVLAEALSLAAQMNQADVCEFLLDHGADPARAPLYGLTALHFAASVGARETAELLVARGASLKARDKLHRGTPLDWSIHNGTTDRSSWDCSAPTNRQADFGRHRDRGADLPSRSTVD